MTELVFAYYQVWEGTALSGFPAIKNNDPPKSAHSKHAYVLECTIWEEFLRSSKCHILLRNAMFMLKIRSSLILNKATQVFVSLYIVPCSVSVKNRNKVRQPTDIWTRMSLFKSNSPSLYTYHTDNWQVPLRIVELIVKTSGCVVYITMKLQFDEHDNLHQCTQCNWLKTDENWQQTTDRKCMGL